MLCRMSDFSCGELIPLQQSLAFQIDGTEFDSSCSRNKPAIIHADRVTECWREALQLMQEVAKWELFIPAKLAYGDKGEGKIQPNSTLIFEVQLIKVE